MTFFLPLILAHIIADFFLQTDKINEGKKTVGKRRWLYLLLHCAIHAVTAYFLLGQWSNWKVPLMIFVSHYAIDTIKIAYEKKNIARSGNTTQTFLLDQMAHLAVIGILASYYDGRALYDVFRQQFFCYNNILKYLIGYALILKPTAIFMNLLLSKWNLNDFPANGLPHAGKWIGFLERTLVVTFILTDNVEGIGFLLAAKSVFRFGDLNKAKDIKTTEYVLLGTLVSFTIAILMGFVIKSFLF
ncbi:MAG: DUF3307 domain-containing protein [Prevotellaceae bacterium]|nr:DUF3307 domain-containing protein [Prevotellaceae bacterium]MDY3365045.1 DUF3307 domain-containing protein [Prevotella sp.]